MSQILTWPGHQSPIPQKLVEAAGTRRRRKGLASIPSAGQVNRGHDWCYSMDDSALRGDGVDPTCGVPAVPGADGALICGQARPVRTAQAVIRSQPGVAARLAAGCAAAGARMIQVSSSGLTTDSGTG
jgi:hypothetical protein